MTYLELADESARDLDRGKITLGEYEERIKPLCVEINHKDNWIPVSERLPENNEAVNITYVNHDPESYYSSVKDKPFTATGVYFSGSWYWWSSTVQDYLDEYGRFEPCKIDEAVEILAWQPLPKPYHTESENK